MSSICEICNTKVLSLRKQVTCAENLCNNVAHLDCVKNIPVSAEGWKCKKCANPSTKDLMAQILKLTAQIKKMETDMTNSIGATNELIEENNQLIKKQDEKLDECFNRIEVLEAEGVKVKEENELLKRIINTQEQYTRLNALEIEGFPELKEENVVSTVLKIAQTLNVTLREEHIDCCYRVEKPKNKDKSGPRPIFVRFVSRIKKEEIMCAKRVKRLLNVNAFYPEVRGVEGEKPIYVNESLTGPNKALFGKCREFKRANEIKFLWVKNGKIRMRKSEKSRVYTIESEAGFNDVH